MALKSFVQRMQSGDGVFMKRKGHGNLPRPPSCLVISPRPLRMSLLHLSQEAFDSRPWQQWVAGRPYCPVSLCPPSTLSVITITPTRHGGFGENRVDTCWPGGRRRVRVLIETCTGEGSAARLVCWTARLCLRCLVREDVALRAIR